MRALNQRLAMLAAAAAVVAWVGAGAALGGDRRRPKPVDVDIESLKSEIRPYRDEWWLDVRYKVEIEHYRRGERYELVVRLTEHDYEIVDREGRPVEFVIPLDRPTDIDKHELKFKQRVTISLPLDMIGDPGYLRLDGDVYRIGDNRSLDHKSKSVKHKKPKRRRCGVGVGLGLGVGIGYGVSLGVNIGL